MSDEVDLYDAHYGETPIDEDAREYLTERYKTIRTKAELNQAESSNIALAAAWLRENSYSTPADLLNQSSLRQLHEHMFGEVWTWAGRIRSRETNLGVQPNQITHQWQIVLGNTLWHIDHDTYPREEIGVRLHWEMVAIHCFPNGNGRHARLTANEVARVLGLGRSFYTWGRTSGADPTEVRRQYLDSIRHADATGECGPLLAFATS